MKLKKITYSESRKLTTGTKFESRMVSITGEMELNEFDNKNSAMEELKQFVKKELKQEIAENTK